MIEPQTSFLISRLIALMFTSVKQAASLAQKECILTVHS